MSVVRSIPLRRMRSMVVVALCVVASVIGNADSLKKVDTRRFMQNALSWLNQSQGKIFVYKYNEANVGMSELGASVVEDLSALNTCGVLITYPDSLPAGDLDVVRDFIKGGGGLLCTDG